MLARLHSVALVGIEALPCEIEVDVPKRGFKGPTIVGLPDAAVKESVHRIKSALNNCGYHLYRLFTHSGFGHDGEISGSTSCDRLDRGS